MNADYRGAFVNHNFLPRLPAGEPRAAWIGVENRGRTTWHPDGVQIVVTRNGEPCDVIALTHPIEPNCGTCLHWMFEAPTSPGPHAIAFVLVKDDTAFEPEEDATLAVTFETFERPATRARRLRDAALDTQCWYWLPAGGVTWSRDGADYPALAREAKGCRIVDLEGREYVDYLMGWGSSLLGYAEERVQRAIASVLGSGAMLSLGHEVMPEVSTRLCAMFPGAEAVTFGKNGSDVCTAAVRMARACTGRHVVLTCGYHGWQDWYVDKFGFETTGVPDRPERLNVTFEFNNIDSLAAVLEKYRGRVAAVMLEPAGPVESLNGPIRDADPVFLKRLVELAHQEGALAIFDEVMTGFRYRGGSVQHATGAVPDLTCLGKAISNGMALSALIGSRDIFDASQGRIFYEPTFKGEMYSLAAAREALAIYDDEDVPARVWAYGKRLKETIDAIFVAARVPAEVVGPPFRMLVSFKEPNKRRRSLMRTLVQQELLKKGVLTYQHQLIPCAAHDDAALEVTRVAFEHAASVLGTAMKGDRFAEYLEIPPM